MLARWFAGCLLLLATGAAAQEFKLPRISYLSPDWDTALASLGDNEAARRLAPAPTSSSRPAESNLKQLARLNAATGKFLPGIALSPVPVLLPLKRPDALPADTRPPADSVNEIFASDFGAPQMFLAGPAGYDAAFTLDLPGTGKRSNERAPRKVEISISGFSLLYELGERHGGEDKPPIGLQADFPDLRRLYLEGRMRYLFRRYGALYEVSIECFDGRSNRRRLPCQDAHTIAVPFLKALTIAGGNPQPAAQAVPLPEPRQPEKISGTFSYYPPGQLIGGTGARKRGGDTDNTVYSTIRFPIAEAPAQVYSQLFMDRGDCTFAAGDSERTRRHGSPFRCTSLDGDGAPMPSGGRFSYPWRDNFCETRGFSVSQCPAGMGHQGEDIVPVDCRMSSRDQDQCERKDHAVVAVRDGVILRLPGEEALMLVANGGGEHLRFRYLHMNPKRLDADGLLSGRPVREGAEVGVVGNYAGREAGTSYHLHFDMQVPTNDGWVFVNPYLTLISAYERLIGERGAPLPEDTVRETAISNDEITKTVSAPAKITSRPRGRQKSASRRH